MSTSFLRGLMRFWTLPVLSLSLVALGCGAGETQGEAEDTASFDEALTSTQKRAVCDHIKTVATNRGITNPLIVSGVPNHETGLVQCWKDATWACQGPHSNYCGGPVIAGSGDGPCSQQQGGLGMYQFDAGTYAQTLAAYGNGVVELDGAIDKGINTIIQKVWHCSGTPSFNNEAEVVAWMNAAKPGTASYEVFLSAMAQCYNGCQPGWSCYEPMRTNYRNGAQTLLTAFGNDYWFGGAVGSSGCTAQETSNAAAFGCACVNHQPNGGYCPGTGCTSQETTNAAAFGCSCVDHQGNGGYCPGTGCTAKETNDAAAFGCACVNHQGNGGYCPGTGCTVKETNDAAQFGCACVDHKGNGGYCPGTGCTAKETSDAAKFGCGCVDHKAAGGFCAGTGCTAKETNDCAAFGKACSLHKCAP
jgi:hypothetical protein